MTAPPLPYRFRPDYFLQVSLRYALPSFSRTSVFLRTLACADLFSTLLMSALIASIAAIICSMIVCIALMFKIALCTL